MMNLGLESGHQEAAAIAFDAAYIRGLEMVIAPYLDNAPQSCQRFMRNGL
jgi:hypothetical protein